MADTFQLSSIDICQVNEHNSKLLSSILARVQSVDVDKLKALESADMSMEYWELLKTSKSSIKSFKNKVDSIADVCDEWNKILLQQMDGKQLQKKQIDFTSYVADEFKAYFDNDDAIFNQKNQQWVTFNEQVAKILNKRSDQTKSSDIRGYGPMIKKCSAPLIVAGVFMTASGNVFLGGTALTIGVAILYKGHRLSEDATNNIKTEEIKADESDDDLVLVSFKDHDDIKNDDDNNELLQLPSFTNTQQFFSAFIDDINNMTNKNLKTVQSNLQTVTKGSRVLQKQCKNMIADINAKQDAYNQ
eukprot:131209_1